MAEILSGQLRNELSIQVHACLNRSLDSIRACRQVTDRRHAIRGIEDQKAAQVLADEQCRERNLVGNVDRDNCVIEL